MAIRGFGGKDRLTPKQKAQELVWDQMVALLHGYWKESEPDYDHETDTNIGPTEREYELIDDQLYKLAKRVAKVCGVEFE